MLDLSADGLAAMTAELAKNSPDGGKTLALTVDIADPEAIAAAVAQIKDAEGFGLPDILGNPTRNRPLLVVDGCVLTDCL